MTGTADPLQQNGPRPVISIVMATYNRPAVLAFAIRSVLAQDFADWELIVVGDRCSEATGALVGSFADDRIRYVNLALNFGEQSGPNNVGIARARGRYVAFLNHDDCWFPDHLRSAMDWLEASGADVVIARSATIRRAAQKGEQQVGWQVKLTGIGRAGLYDPVHTFGPTSTLLIKHSVAQAAGPLRPASDSFSTSSQEWLFRMWKRGFRLCTMPHLTVIQFPSGLRPRSYVEPDISEHAYFEPQLKRPLELRLLLLDRVWTPPPHPLWKRFARSVALAGLRAAAHIGLPPSELLARIFLGYRRGRYIDELREMRGLSSIPEREPSPSSLRARYAERQSSEKT